MRIDRPWLIGVTSVLFIVVLALLVNVKINLTFADAEPVGIGNCSDLLYKPGIALGMAVIVAVFLVVLIYMLATFIRSREFIAKTHVESANIASSAIISVIILITLYALCVYCANYITGGVPLYSYVRGELLNIEGLALSRAQELTRAAMSNEFQSIYYLFAGTPFTPSGGAGKAYRSYYSAVSAHQNIIIDILLIQYMTAKTFDAVFMFMSSVGLGALLPLAVVLRIFPIVRTVGNYLLAFVFAFGVILPFVFALNLGFGPSLSEIPEYSDPFIGSYSEIAYIVAHMLFFPNVAIAIAATMFMAVGRGLDSISIV